MQNHSISPSAVSIDDPSTWSSPRPSGPGQLPPLLPLHVDHASPPTSRPSPPRGHHHYARQHYRQTLPPVDLLARKLSMQSLRPQNPTRAVFRTRSFDRRPPVTDSDIRSSLMAMGLRDPMAMDVDAAFDEDFAMLASYESHEERARQAPVCSPLDIILPHRSHRLTSLLSHDTRYGTRPVPTHSVRHIQDQSSYAIIAIDEPHKMCPALAADIEEANLDLTPDEGYCEGTDDFAWIDECQVLSGGLAGTLRSNGVLRWRTSSEAAQRCPKLVRNQPRIRKRNQLKRDHQRSRASTVTSDIVSTVDASAHTTLPQEVST